MDSLIEAYRTTVAWLCFLGVIGLVLYEIWRRIHGVLKLKATVASMEAERLKVMQHVNELAVEITLLKERTAGHEMYHCSGGSLHGTRVCVPRPLMRFEYDITGDRDTDFTTWEQYTWDNDAGHYRLTATTTYQDKTEEAQASGTNS